MAESPDEGEKKGLRMSLPQKSSPSAAPGGGQSYREIAERMKQVQEEQRLVVKRMKEIPYKVAILSSKGGVGKSFVTANLAMALATMGKVVGVLDADFHGPSMPMMLGLRNVRGLLAREDGSIVPAVNVYGVRLVSVGLMLPSDDAPVIWRGSIKTTAIRQLLAYTDWEGAQYLLIDLPPGTGDEQLTIAQTIPGLTGFLLVTIPSEVSKIVVKKAAAFAEKLNVPLLGIVENMSYFKCPDGSIQYIFGKGAAEEIAKEYNIPFLGQIPLDPHIREANDNGEPFFLEYPDSEAAKSFLDIAKKFIDVVEKGNRTQAQSS
ncbi:MRP/NBP35 family protein [Acidilobus saccharovorans 345-15]|uniref:Iron-sulfur cluster carrier protein n=2 Tax=Acidilobus TaxID=105850 RepID=D9Q200_ACIS3|nr:Mrp/NBP35 family ATP-binding protein [Acidilobus saccharovorans]ADL19338.1 MRP/NBP35 family protein [Acidilobus saccharovorans 345-15]